MHVLMQCSDELYVAVRILNCFALLTCIYNNPTYRHSVVRSDYARGIFMYMSSWYINSRLVPFPDCNDGICDINDLARLGL